MQTGVPLVFCLRLGGMTRVGSTCADVLTGLYTCDWRIFWCVCSVSTKVYF